MREAAAKRLVLPDFSQRIHASGTLGLLGQQDVDTFGKICEVVRVVSTRNDREPLESNAFDVAIAIGARRRLFDNSVARCRRHKW